MNCRFPRPAAGSRLICFPWAGGGASFYTAWGKDVTHDVEVLAMCLPGRENRFREACRSDVKDTLAEIVAIMERDYLDKPFLFFGHSMGALLAFLVGLELKTRHNKQPQRLLVSGTYAPQSEKRRSRQRNVKSMTQGQFLDELKSLGGTPKEILENKQLLDIFLPPLQADFSMLEEMTYEYNGTPPLTCPIDLFDGEDDVDHDCLEWQDLTSGPFKSRSLPGGHFYIKEPANTATIISHINDSLRYNQY